MTKKTTKAALHRRSLTPFLASLLAFPIIVASAQTSGEESKESETQLPHALTLLTGPGLSTSAHLADDLRSLLSSSAGFRLFPSIGNGDFANVDDILSRDFVDMAFVQVDTLNHLLNADPQADIDEDLTYVTITYKAEFHLLVKSDIVSLDMLRGKTVNFGPNLEGTYLTATEVFADRDIDVTAMTLPHQRAYALLKEGGIDAMVIVDGKPSRLLDLASLDDGVRLMSVPMDRESDDYVTSTIRSSDYPDLLAAGDDVQTIAVPIVLVAYNWQDGSDRRQILDLFTEALLAELSTLRSEDQGFHPKWRETDVWSRLSTPWQRYPKVLKVLNPMKRFEQESEDE